MKKKRQKEQDLFALMTEIREQLAVLDKKVDAVLNKSASSPAQARPSSPPGVQRSGQPQVQEKGRQRDHRHVRPLYRATCADCNKDCELPFKPSGNRPVYCKECFLRRKTGGAGGPLKASEEYSLKKMPPVQAAPRIKDKDPDPSVNQKNTPSAVKKSAVKKKTVTVEKKTVPVKKKPSVSRKTKTVAKTKTVSPKKKAVVKTKTKPVASKKKTISPTKKTSADSKKKRAR